MTVVYNRPLLLMGDFNYSDIDWSTSYGGSAASQRFVDSVEPGGWLFNAACVGWHMQWCHLGFSYI